VTRIERKAPFLDDHVIAVQEGSDAWCEEPGVAGRVWCVLSQRLKDVNAPDGWFILAQGIGNRKTNADLIKHQLLEIKVAPFTRSDGETVILGRIRSWEE